MADLSDVEQALVGLVAQVIYPHGTSQPSILGVDCRVFRGWPTAKALETDLRAGRVNVNIYALDVERNVTRYLPTWQTRSVPAATLTTVVSGNTVTLGGAVAASQNAAVIVDGRGYSYPVQSTDTLAGIATALAALISADRSASSAGAVLTIPNAKHLTARIGVFGTVIREVKRQQRQININFWCPNPTARDTALSAVDAALAGTPWIDLPDGTRGRLIYQRTYCDDGQQKEQLYRRWLVYQVEFATTQQQQAATVVITRTNIDGGNDPSSPNIASIDT